MRKYKVFTNFTNHISIDETELEKALKAFQKGLGVVFQNGATQRIESVLPDDNKMMGWNEGYKPTPEELGEIGRDRLCISSRRLMAEMKEHLALNPGQPFQERIESPYFKKHTDGPTNLKNLLPPKE